mgnify:CR=1 FL=1
MTIGNFDLEDRDLELAGWDYADRAIGLLDAIETIKGENVRDLSPLNGLICPFSKEAASSNLKVVVPTEIIFPPFFLQA